MSEAQLFTSMTFPEIATESRDVIARYTQNREFVIPLSSNIATTTA